MKIAEIHNRIYAIPETWNELTGKQLVKVMEVLYSEMEADVARLALLRIVTGMGWWRWCRTPLWQKMEFLYLGDFLIISNTLTKNLLPKIGNFYGPADDFNNIKGDEFVFSEDFYFKSFSQSDENEPRVFNEAMLNELVAVLYREKKPDYNTKINPDGDARIPFNQNICAHNAKMYISKWPMAVKLAIFTWYEICRKEMIEQNPEIFSGGSGEPARYGLISVMRVIAEGGIHGTFENVQQMEVKMWMVELNEKHEEAKRNAQTNN